MQLYKIAVQDIQQFSTDGIRLTVRMLTMKCMCGCLCLLFAVASTVWSEAGAGMTGWSVHGCCSMLQIDVINYPTVLFH